MPKSIRNQKEWGKKLKKIEGEFFEEEILEDENPVKDD